MFKRIHGRIIDVLELIAPVTILIPWVLWFVFKHYYPEIMTFDNVMSSLEKVYSTYGMIMVFVAGIIEAIVLVNFFFPGSSIILLGAMFAKTGAMPLWGGIFLGSFGLIIGFVINYYIGRFGWHSLIKRSDRAFSAVQKTVKKIDSNKFIYFWSTIHPYPASIVALSSGVVKVKFIRFFLSIAVFQLFWSTFWGLIFYTFGFYILERRSFFFILFIAMMAVVIYQMYNKYRETYAEIKSE